MLFPKSMVASLTDDERSPFFYAIYLTLIAECLHIVLMCYIELYLGIWVFYLLFFFLGSALKRL